MLTLTALRLLFADLPLILYLEQLILTDFEAIKRNVVFIYASRNCLSPLPGIFLVALVLAP